MYKRQGQRHVDSKSGKLIAFRKRFAVASDTDGQSSYKMCIRDSCTGETGGRLGNFRELDIRVELLVAGMYLEDSLTALDIRCTDIDLTVETARTQQRVIQNILAVGGCDDDNACLLYTSRCV